MSANSPNSPEASTVSAPTSTDVQLRNFLIVAVAVVLSVVLFLCLRTQTQTVSLREMAQASMPLDVALSNDKPTLMEFYADRCTSCQAMAPDIQALKQDYQDQINFVMLNVDNSKWLPEILRYQVDGIPQFVFLDPQGAAIASTVGQQPRAILAANLSALAADQPLPYLQAGGRISAFQTPVKANADDPRAHGGLPAS
jgi:thiol-disulfide isomerase/thioredoxin